MRARRASAPVGARRVFVRGVDANAALAPDDAQQAPVVHLVEQPRRGARRTSPVVRHAAVRETRVHHARVYGALFAHEFEEALHAFRSAGRPARGALPRVHQALHRAGDEPIVDEEVLVDVERRIAAFQIPRAVALDAVTERQVLRPRRGTDGVGLHEAQPVQGALQRGRREEAPRDREAAQVVQRESGHSEVLFSVLLRKQRDRDPRYGSGVGRATSCR